MERHKLDFLSLFAGIVFVAIALVGVTDAVAFTVYDLRWLGPVALVTFGVVLVITAGTSVARRGETRDEALAGDTAPGDDPATDDRSVDASVDASADVPRGASVEGEDTPGARPATDE